MGRDKLLHIIGKNHCPANPLPVNLAPAKLCPARVRNAHMQLVFLYLLPILRRYNVSQRMSMVVLYHLRVTGCTRSKVNNGGFICLRCSCSGWSWEYVRILGNLFFKILPAVPLSGNQNPMLNARNFALCSFYLLDNIGVIDTNHGMNAGTVATVNQILLGKLQRTRNQDCSDFMQGNRTNPVFPAAAENQHDNRSLANTQMPKIVCGLIRQTRDFRESKGSFVSVIIAPNECFLFRFLLCPFIYDVKPKVKGFRYVDTIILLEVLVTVKFNSREIFVQ